MTHGWRKPRHSNTPGPMYFEQMDKEDERMLNEIENPTVAPTKDNGPRTVALLIIAGMVAFCAYQIWNLI